MVKGLPIIQETQVQSLGWEDLLEKEMVTHSSILAWKIPWTEEPGCKESDTTELLHLLTTKLNISLPNDPAIGPLNVYPNELKTYVHTKTCTGMVIFASYS